MNTLGSRVAEPLQGFGQEFKFLSLLKRPLDRSGGSQLLTRELWYIYFLPGVPLINLHTQPQFNNCREEISDD